MSACSGAHDSLASYLACCDCKVKMLVGVSLADGSLNRCLNTEKEKELLHFLSEHSGHVLKFRPEGAKDFEEEMAYPGE
jgi:hypothetical protein